MIFLGCLYRKECEKELLSLSNTGLPNAVNNFQWNLLNGLIKKTSLEIINVLPVGIYPTQYKKLIMKTIKWSWEKAENNTEIGTINIPIVKQYIRYKKIQKELKLRINNNSNIMIYSTYLPFLKAVYKLDKRIKVTLIVTDLPDFYDLAKVGLVRRILRKINNYFIYKYLSRIDNFVLLTEHMKIPLKVGDRPYVVIEGIIDADSHDSSYYGYIRKENDKKVILYTGTLHYQFGIKTLLEAFKLIKNSDYELWICGSGEAEEEIRKSSLLDNRIKFFGFVVRDVVKKLQQQATILVNPRTNEGEYNKYSFPSKTMEYLKSGKPVLMHKLDGIPDEYDKYLFYFNGTSPKDIATKIVEVMEIEEEERNRLGEAAKHFVLARKNSFTQADKILKMVNDY